MRPWPRAARSPPATITCAQGFITTTPSVSSRPERRRRTQGARAYKVWHQGIRLRYPNIEFIEVPYEGTTLPALFIAAQADGPAPTVVVVNGMDNAKEMSIFFAGLEFSRRGFNTLCLDGPGMGETRRMRDMPSRLRLRGSRRRGAGLS